MINVQTAKTSELVAFYNEHAEQLGKRHITKFADRATAELRVNQMVADLAAAAPAHDELDAEMIERYGIANCPHCGIHLENGVGYHLQEVNLEVIKHKQFMYACLGCGSEFGDPIPAAKEVDAKRSAGVAASWLDPEVKAARSQRNAVSVDGVEYRSVRAAFIALGLPLAKHIKFRLDLKAIGEQAFGKHDFKLL